MLTLPQEVVDKSSPVSANVVIKQPSNAQLGVFEPKLMFLIKTSSPNRRRPSREGGVVRAMSPDGPPPPPPPPPVVVAAPVADVVL